MGKFHYDEVPRFRRGLLEKYQRELENIKEQELKNSIKECEKKLNKKFKKTRTDEQEFINLVAKRVISFTIKIATILFFLFTPIGQEASIKIGTKVLRDGTNFIEKTFNERMEKYGVFDYSKPRDLRIATGLVVVYIPCLLIVVLLITLAGVIGAWRRARRQEDIDWLNERIEDQEWHRKAMRYKTYKDIYNLP